MNCSWRNELFTLRKSCKITPVILTITLPKAQLQEKWLEFDI